MQFTTAFSVALIAMAKLALADSQAFGLLAIHSGSPVQNTPVNSENGALVLKSGGSFAGTVTDAGKLKFSDNTYAVVNSDGSIKTGSESEGTSGFALSGSHLTYKGNSGFFAIPSGSEYKFSTAQGTGAIDIVISPRSTKDGSVVADFTPAGSASSAASSAKPSSAAASSAAPTKAAISQIGDGQIQATSTIHQQTTNGAAKAAAGMGAGAIAAIAVLL